MTLLSTASTRRLLEPGRARLAVEELLGNSVYYPIVLVMMNVTSRPPAEFLRDPTLLVLAFAVLTQSWFLGDREHKGQPRPLLGSLVAPAAYSVSVALVHGIPDLALPINSAYWLFAILIGGLQQLRLTVRQPLERALQVIESIVRTSVLLVGYWISQGLIEAVREPVGPFAALARPDVFMGLTVLFIGLSIGLANATSRSYLLALRRNSARLQVYSEWLLGRHLLAEAIRDPSALVLQRKYRAVIFSDIRGFTRWSESQRPERVVQLLNEYFATSERFLLQHDAIKAKYTGDEVLAVFRTANRAVAAASQLREPIEELLAPYGLGAGIGVHAGTLVEGVMGGNAVKAYDVVGDVVNTAKRICDQAEAGEILVSEDVLADLGGRFGCLPTRLISAKGKSRPLRVYSLGDGSSAGGQPPDTTSDCAAAD